MSGKRARAQRTAGHSHEKIIYTLSKVAEVCQERHYWTAQQLHAIRGTDTPRRVRRGRSSPRFLSTSRRRRPRSWGEDFDIEYRRQRRRGRRGGRRSLAGAALAAPGRVLLRRVMAPVRAVESVVWVVLWAVLAGWVLWSYAAPQPLKDFGAWIIPGSCSAPQEPPTVTKGAVWAAHDAGDGLRRLSKLDVQPEQIRDGIRAASLSVGQMFGALQLGIEGKPSPVDKSPLAERREGQLESVAMSAAGCTPCPGSTVRQASATTAPAAGVLTDVEVVAIAREVGWPEAEITSGRLGAYVLAESGNDPTERDYVDGSHQGLLQMGQAEQRATGIVDPYSPRQALRGALTLWQERGWQPWTASATSHVQYLERAQAAAGGTSAAPAAVTAQPVCTTASATSARAASAGLEGLTNGEIPADRLCSFSWAPNHRGRCDAVLAAEALNAAYRAEFGKDISITDSYRDMAGQVACEAAKGSKRTGGGLCAVPGTSNHGWGVALDLGGGIQRFGTREHRWFEQAGAAFGWITPDWAQQDGSKPEPWHKEYAGAGAAA